MSYTREFIKDRLLTHDSHAIWSDVIAIVYARWKITNSEYPDGFAYHYFQTELNVAGLSNNTIVEIETHNLAEIQHRHKLAQLTEYYTNPNITPSP
jgi:hypothetical protein